MADRTNGFTGADLQAVLFTAQMTAYEALHQGTHDGTVTCIHLIYCLKIVIDIELKHVVFVLVLLILTITI